MVFGVGGSNGAICGSIKSKMAADSHLGMTALSRVTLASAGLSCVVVTSRSRTHGVDEWTGLDPQTMQTIYTIEPHVVHLGNNKRSTSPP